MYVCVGRAYRVVFGRYLYINMYWYYTQYVLRVREFAVLSAVRRPLMRVGFPMCTTESRSPLLL